MKVAIEKDRDFDLADILFRSPVANVVGAEEILKECMWRSVEVRYGLVDGEVACIWGMIPPTLLSTTAYLWLLTTDIVVEHKFLFIRHSQRYIEEALKTYPVIIGDCIVGNDAALKWLKWLGASFAPPILGRMPFTITARVLNG